MFLALNSGGIDSPVAAHLILKKKYEINFVYFDNGDTKTRERTIDTIKRLAAIHSKKFALCAVPLLPLLDKFLEKTGRWDKKFICIFCKRMMYRIAERIAEKEGYKGLVTGENLGQVASQTLQNLSVLEEPVELPVLRPLLCMDKEEIVAIAREIGTYKISIGKSKECSYVPKYPAINTRLEKIKELEEMLDIERMIKRSVKRSTL
ncbi:MAG: hypothetical protein U9N35_01605 [Euryarchaeota archaeon]|nr:hypothetical protein [Euryarchaeota archaeon]